MANVKISFLAPVYNEAARIGSVLTHATAWADEIVIVDKGSTDGTLEICRSFGDRVRVVSIPYSERGHEDMTRIPTYVTEGWIFFGTCSEVPTRELIRKCREVLDARADQLDLIYVPRLMHFFGQHCSPKNGGISYYPFMFHKDRVRITNDIHDNFHAPDAARTHRIPYAENCCVYHLTHPTARSFWNSSLTYFEMEAQKKQAPDKALRDAFKNIEKLARRMGREGDNWIPFYCALASYELGKALFIWEQEQGRGSAAAYYQELIPYLVQSEWNPESATATPLARPTPPVAPSLSESRGLQKLLPVLAAFPYLLMKLQIQLRRIFR